jgi:hypothetical protein
LYPGYYAIGTDGNNQVGDFNAGNAYAPYAFLSTANGSSFTSLNPTSIVDGISTPWYYSVAEGVNAGKQVGFGYPSNASYSHAVLWSGTAASAVDLNPTTFTSSVARGVGGGIEVGDGLATAANQVDALLWTGTAASAVDLNRPGDVESAAYRTDGVQEVGYGETDILNGTALN